MNLLGSIGFGGKWFGTPRAELPKLFPLPINEAEFIKIDTITIYKRILTDVLERTYGIPTKRQSVLWDSCLKSESSNGLVSLLSEAMFNKAELYLVYRGELNILRKATSSEQNQIKADYEKGGDSTVGFYISFKKFELTDMLKVYSALEYCTISSLYKSENISTAIQVKINEMRKSISEGDSKGPIERASAIAQGLEQGRAVILDAGDTIEMATPDLTSVEKAMSFIDRKRSFYLGLPANYITGLSGASMSDSGEKEAKAVERGLKSYYFSIIAPVVDKMFGIVSTFKSEDFYGLTTALSALTTFNMDSGEYISHENKTQIINKLFGLPEDAEGDEPSDGDNDNASKVKDIITNETTEKDAV